MESHMIIESKFKPAWWMTNPHLQTIYCSIRHPVCPSLNDLEKIDLPDGDFVELVWSRENLSDNSPLVIILHGLGGCVNSSYVARFMQAFNQRGWRAVLMHFRGAGTEPNRLPRAYHLGDTADFDFVVNYLSQREPQTQKAAVGVSLGGNVLLKWLGERSEQAAIKTAVAISVPYLLNKVANRMNIGLSRIYQKYLLSHFKSVFARKLEQFSNTPELLKKAANCHCFWTFDSHVTAPLNGFSSVHTYYRESSSRQYLRKIQIPTLLIHAVDDPFMTQDVLPKEEELSKHVVLEISQKGGHMGFVAGRKPGVPIYWLDSRIPEYIDREFEKKI